MGVSGDPAPLPAHKGSEIFVCALPGRIRLIGDTPHNDAGVVLISGDQVSYDVLVVLLGLHSVLFVICADLLTV